MPSERDAVVPSFFNPLRLDVTDVDLSTRQVVIRDGKGRKDRVVPVLGRAWTALDLYLREVRPLLDSGQRHLAVFLALGGRRMSKASVCQIVRRYARAVGVPSGVSPHVLRHTCATHLLKGGADIRQIQQLLGHKSVETTEAYVRVAVVDLKDVVNRAHPRRRRR